MTTQANRPIGVFDSGMGGLTVLRALRKALPDETFIYLGDTARLPYGSKSASTVARYASQAARILVEREVKLLVVACNTASAVALQPMRSQLASGEFGERNKGLPVLGVVVPGAAALSLDQQTKVWVLATESTVGGGAYFREILARQPHKKVYSRACPLLVALAEEGRTDGPLVELALTEYLAGTGLLPNPPYANHERPALLLGCTHFPVFRPTLTKMLGSQVTIYDSAATTARAVVEFLAQANLGRRAAGALASDDAGVAVEFLATDGARRFCRVGETFLGEAISSVELVDL